MVMVLSLDVCSLLMVLAGQHRTPDGCGHLYVYEVTIWHSTSTTHPLGQGGFTFKNLKLATHFCASCCNVYSLTLGQLEERGQGRGEKSSFSCLRESRACGMCQGSIPSSPCCWLSLPKPCLCHSGMEGMVRATKAAFVLESSSAFPCLYW